MTLFIAFAILPLMFLAWAVSYDLLRFYADNTILDHHMDQAVLAATRSLPDRKAAEGAARSYLSLRMPDLFGETRGATVTLNSHGDTVFLEVEALHRPAFTGIVEFFFEKRKDIGIPLHRFSEGALTPNHVFIALDLSPHVAPIPASGTAWGPHTHQPTPHFFDKTHRIIIRKGTENVTSVRLTLEQLQLVRQIRAFV